MSRPALIVTVAGAVGCAAATALPWARSGTVTRSGYRLARVLDTLGFADTVPRRALVVAVALLPLLAALTWVAGALHRPLAVATLGAATALVAGIGGVVVLVSPVGVGLGPAVAVAAGATTLAGALALVRQETR